MKKIYTLLLVLMSVVVAWAQNDVNKAPIDAHWFNAHYKKTECMIPMRDGAKLYTAIYTPKNKKALHPILLNRTSNGCDPYGKKSSDIWQKAIFADYLQAEYIMVFQDVRGSGKSIGSNSGDNQQDAYDCAEYLLRKIKKHNGCIGVWGIGEDSAYVLDAAVCGHPAIKALSVQAPTADNWSGKITIPSLFVGGWFDIVSKDNLWDYYSATKEVSPLADCRLAIGPWAHGAWRDNIAATTFDEAASVEFYSQEIEFPFFDHYLRGAESSGATANGGFVYFSGENCWRELDSWQQSDKTLSLYLNEDGALCEEQPRYKGAYSRYTSDPETPIPVTENSATDITAEKIFADHSFADGRADILTFISPIFDRDVTVTGAIEIELYAMASQPTADFVVKVIDVVNNDDTEMLVRGEWVADIPMENDKAQRVVLKMTDMAHTFMEGDRIKVQIHSTWYPIVKGEGKESCDITILHDAEHPSKIVLPL